jgi:hypothetical protein
MGYTKRTALIYNLKLYNGDAFNINLNGSLASVLLIIQASTLFMETEISSK